MSPGRSSDSAAAARAARLALARALHPAEPDYESLIHVAERNGDVLLREAEWGGAHAYLAWRLDQAGQLVALPEPVRLRLRQLVLRAQMAGTAIQEAAEQLAGVLAGAGIRFILLKGAALVRLVYEAPAHRPMSDIDVLIDPARFDEALEALREAGFRLPSDETLAFTREFSKCVPVRLPAGGDPELELHWSIVAEDRQRVDVAGLFERAQPIAVSGVPALALGATDLLLHQSLHHAYHVFEPKLIWLVDLALLHCRRPPPDPILKEARRWPMRTPLALSVLHLEKVFPGVVHPTLARLANTSRARAYAALAGDPDPLTLLRGWKSPKTQIIWKLLMLDGPRQAAAQLRTWLTRARRHGAAPGQVVEVD